MINKYNAYNNDNENILDDKHNLSIELIEKINKEERIIEDNPDTLKEIIDMDLRENVPPQIYEVISSVVDMIVKAEKL